MNGMGKMLSAAKDQMLADPLVRLNNETIANQLQLRAGLKIAEENKRA